jgi:hypothetical protein
MLFCGCAYIHPENEGEGTKSAATSEQAGEIEPESSESSHRKSEPENKEPGSNEELAGNPAENPTEDPADSQSEPSQAPEAIDYETVRPNEAGKIMVLMFHNFVEEYTGGDWEFTMTLDAFEELLHTLYEKRYRLISLDDYVNNRISTPAGCIPIVFTFDDGTPGQFSLVETEDGLKINERTAVGIMMKFAETHPDFGLEGTFFLYLGADTFKGAGTLQQRLQVLIDNGFDIGNHTLTHADLSQVKDAKELQKQLGGNNAKLVQLVNDCRMKHLSLPFGNYPPVNREYLVSGEYEGIPYNNLSILEVGWDPYFSPVSRNFNPHAMHRVRAPGIKPADCDLNWWLERLSREEQYVSDGNPDTVAVPEEAASSIDPEKLGDKILITY